MGRPDLKTPHREMIKKLAGRQREGDCSRVPDSPLQSRQTTVQTTMTKAASTPSAGAQAQAAPASYEAGLQELEQLVAQLESGQMPLADLLSAYQRGAFLLNHCREQLQAVENQIQVLEAGSLKAWSGE